MKPKTKYHKHVASIQETLPRITKEQKQYAYDHCFGSYYVVSRNRNICLECNHKWDPKGPHWHDEVAGVTCPSCQKKLTKISYQSSVYEREEYFAIVTVVKGFQVIRTFMAKKIMRKKERPRYFIMEVVQQFMDETGKTTHFAKMLAYGYGTYLWQYGSEVELRDAYDVDRRYIIHPAAIWPKKKILPIIKRNGYKSGFHGQTPHLFMHSLLTDPQFETLVKAKQFGLVRHYGQIRMKNHWRSIRIAIRNNYIVKDATIWLDYLDLLIHFKKDILNAKYVCPPDLKAAHNELVQRQREADRIERELREHHDAIARAARLERDKQTYPETMSRFFDLVFTDGDLTITPLKSVEEFKEEGEELFHCVYLNGYYRKKDSLCLSARINGKRTETIEVNLKTFEIIQSRGYDNEPTEHHDRIVELVNRNMSKIRRAKNKKTNETKDIQLKTAC